MNCNGKDIAIGERVEWTNGAVGLTGKVIGFIRVPLADNPFNQLVKVETDNGVFDEYPQNLRVFQ